MIWNIFIRTVAEDDEKHHLLFVVFSSILPGSGQTVHRHSVSRRQSEVCFVPPGVQHGQAGGLVRGVEEVVTWAGLAQDFRAIIQLERFSRSYFSTFFFTWKIIDINIYKYERDKPLYLSSYVAGWLPKIKSENWIWFVWKGRISMSGSGLGYKSRHTRLSVCRQDELARSNL